MKPARREFIATAACAAAGVALRARASERPNILIIIDDQDRQPMHGLPIERKNRERLRSSSVEFTSAYCTYPLCSPSRASIMTGLWPHQTGILTNVDFAAKNPSLPRDLPCLGRVFSEAGYKTAYFGKWHLSRRAHTIGNLRRYGFDSPHVSNQLYAIGSDDRVAGNAARWIEHSGRRAPWLMVCSLINPHDICFPFLDKVYPVEPDRPVTLPPNFSLERAPDIESLRNHSEIGAVEKMLPADEQSWLAYLRLYCHLVEDADRNMGRVLDALEQSGQKDDTVVVFSSDHGEMGGSHGLAHKGPTMYEENMRVPLWISGPGVAGGRGCDSLVSNLDIVPTLCALAGVRWPGLLEGMDLAPVLHGAEAIERDHLFAEGSPRMTASWRGVRTRDWKYWRYSTGEELLFDLAGDSLEMNNLAGDPESKDALEQFREMVNQWRARTNDPVRD